MKCLLTVISLLISGFLAAQSLESVYSYTKSDYFDKNTETWIPSKCDCDFEQEVLSIRRNRTFILKYQRGRLSPETSYKYGTWQKTGNSLILTITRIKGGMIPLAKEDKKGKMQSYTKTFTILDHQIFDGHEYWTGRFSPTIIKK